ncbi:MAG TPA: T9SS type A sorting domain-containing protein [Bacteroidetes bacterium]|nr:T9SS type A sorting domain-containing protein [Bacteroidota bacterium]
MKQALFVLVLGVAVALAGSASARSKRVGQIPNGNVFSCANCHISPGGPRNAFGAEIERNYLDANGDVIWNASLAGLDSDGDGATNGAELQDPTGQWRVGQANPGDPNQVTNPGDPNSVPTAVQERVGTNLPRAFHLGRAYPNPFNPQTTIAFDVPGRTFLRLSILDVAGRVVRVLANGTYVAGHYTVNWDGRDALGRPLASGVYICVLESPGFRAAERLLLLR